MKTLALSSFLLFSFLSGTCFAANKTASSADWQLLFSADSISSAGTNTYGETYKDNNNTTRLVVNKVDSNFGYQIAAQRLLNHETWYISYLNYAPNWQTNSTTSPTQFSGPFKYSGKDNYQEFDFQHGYQLKFTPTFYVNVHAGFAYLSEKSSVDLAGKYNGTGNHFKHGESQFSGFGPSIGYLLLRNLSTHFTFSNTTNIGMAYGAISSSSYKTDKHGTPTDYVDIPSHKVLLPYLNMTIALGYMQHLYNNHRVILSVGMQFKQLFNVVHAHGSTNSTYDNLAFYGPFARFVVQL